MLDLEAYVANYTGNSKIQRLIFIGDRSKDLRAEAYKLAIAELQKTLNTSSYNELMHKIHEISEPIDVQYDPIWVEQTERRAQQQQEKLEIDLANYKANVIKESIRMGHNDLGDFFYNRGDLNSAQKCYAQTKDYAATTKHVIDYCLNMIKVGIEMGNVLHVSSYVTRAEKTANVNDPVVIAKLRAVSGLLQLKQRRYKYAARKLLETTIDISGNYSDVMSAQDIAVYAGLTALATFDRSELKEKVIDNSTFKEFLEGAPEIRELINDFYSSRYTSCLRILESIRGDLILDIHLHDHVSALYSMIRSKALIQYFSPFISVSLETMAAAFDTSVAGLEKELAALIMDKQIQARIDSHNKVLYARHADQRNSTFHHALVVGENYVRDTKALMLRMNLLKHDFVVRAPRTTHLGMEPLAGRAFSRS